MITFTVTYPNGTVITRNMIPSQAQMVINAMRADGCTVVVTNNPTNYIIN